MRTLTSTIKNQVIPALCQGGETILFPSGKAEIALQQEKHNYWELCFLSEGKCSFYLAGEQFQLEPNNLVLIPPLTPHSEAWQESEPYSLLWLGLRQEIPLVFFSAGDFRSQMAPRS